jgi:hypothetical protein
MWLGVTCWASKLHIQIGHTHLPALFEDLETYNIVGVPKSQSGNIIGEVHLTPLNSFTDLIPFLKEEDKQEFCHVMITARPCLCTICTYKDIRNFNHAQCNSLMMDTQYPKHVGEEMITVCFMF